MAAKNNLIAAEARARQIERTALAREAIDKWVNWVPFEHPRLELTAARKAAGLVVYTGDTLILEKKDLDLVDMANLLDRVQQLGYDVKMGSTDITICNKGFE